MRLKSIKLAGFKSFVDPTTVNFPSNMAAVVGPNGCGKSNIIDAVRWVMGESSAKNLRGESMTDVIFNGSNTRKPVSQASIELIFDNAETTLVGEYAQYAEISIRRRVSRDGQNTYFPQRHQVPAARHHRHLPRHRPGAAQLLDHRTGHDLQADRGASGRPAQLHRGSRGYFQVQGAPPRNRKPHPSDPGKPGTPHRPARRVGAATGTPAPAGPVGGKIPGTQGRGAPAQGPAGCRALARPERAGRSARAGHRRPGDRLRGPGGRAAWCRCRHRTAARRPSRVVRTLQPGAGALLFGRRRHRPGRAEHPAWPAAPAPVAGRLARSRTDPPGNRIAPWARPYLARDPGRGNGHARTGTGTQRGRRGRSGHRPGTGRAGHAGLAAAVGCLQPAERRTPPPGRGAAVAHPALEQSLERLQDRERRLQDERGQLAADPEDAAILELNEQVAIAELALEELQLQEQGQAERLEQLRQELQQLAAEQHQAQGELQRLNGRIASLEALQQAALDPGQGALEWLREQGLEQRPRLAEGLRVEPGWELAVETVLGADLQAVLLDGFDGLALAGFGKGELRLLSPAHGAATAAGSLLDKVRADADLSPWLARVKPVETLEQALAQRGALDDGESLISRDGYWVGRHFLRVRRSDEAQGGMLARAQELEALQERREVLETRVAEGEERLAAARDEQRELEGAREQVRRQVQEEGRRHGELKAQLSAQQAKVEQLVLRRRRLDEEVAELAEQRALEQEQLSEARLTLQEALDSMALDTERRETLLAERDALRERLDRIRQDARTHKDHAHQLAVRVGSLRAQHNSTQQALERLDQQSARLNERCEQLNLNLEEGAAPLEELRMKLEELLERRMAVEDELKQARLALEDADRELREVEKRRGQAEQQSQLLRGQLEQQRLEWQGLVVRRKALQEQLAEDGYDLHTVLANLPLDASEREWEERLESLAARIQRLGPINLAAIEEYQQQSERKRYLDSQNDDLAEALETLENVIRKIDRETRNRFKETFDQINAGLQALFPKVFGGGTAYLELTGEDLLDTGVAIMARPPGKKNSTIHLLSGGEKALTALALVFAIFQLNPAPFCMLDEVDAPLDDANVGRYARLVKEMSEKVQFIYITHNKIAMEMADQLMGVTMHEPGCSRLVAVDVEEAVALAEA
ncbi:chromosome segregation protein SMC [Pseudomonas aeruginosa]|nr:chromosome segregation protein SMC [Pseudomonas aeruginosa]